MFRCVCGGVLVFSDTFSRYPQYSDDRFGIKVSKHNQIFFCLYFFPDCDDNHWGSACRQSCKCKNGALCDPIKGTCQCPPGFVGRFCEDKCPAGNFGKGCLQKCKCGTGGSCHKATGECLCRDGFTGTL